MRDGLVIVLAATACKVFVVPLFQRMPPPYEGVVARELSAEDMALLPGAAVPTRAFEGKWALNGRLRQATRLFEGQVSGSESVAVFSNGDLVTVDKFGRFFAASRSRTRVALRRRAR